MNTNLPFCKICGDHHRLGHCPLWEEPPVIKYAKKDQPPAQPVEEAGQAAAAQDPWREIYQNARPFTPEDMKQETMPVIRPRFDRNAYQRNLMKRRYWARKAGP